MAIGRGRRRKHPNQHFVLLLRKKYGKKVQEKNTGKKSTGGKNGKKSTGKKVGKIVR